ncbi:MAG TPA: GH32 C-terminal domain-containing protein, partial [Anaerolineales bacterium]|nr:GH32 C-terminal domain-containing protein [Anaerolineales bacterium]
IKDRRLYVDRSAAGIASFNSEFAKLHLAHLPLLDGDRIRLHLFVDNSSVEVFANDGTVVMTEQIFPCGQADHLELFVEGGDVTVNTLDIYELKAASFYVDR